MTNFEDDPVLRGLEEWARAADAGRHEEALRIAQATAELGRKSNNPALRAAAELPLSTMQREMTGVAPSTPTCTFCRAQEGGGLRLIAGPAVIICTECAAACRKTLDEDAAGRSSNTSGWRRAAGVDSVRCSFCPRRSSEVAAMLANDAGAICDVCLVTCDAILRGESPPKGGCPTSGCS